MIETAEEFPVRKMRRLSAPVQRASSVILVLLIMLARRTSESGFKNSNKPVMTLYYSRVKYGLILWYTDAVPMISGILMLSGVPT